MALINAFCLFITLITDPSNLTALAIVPVFVTAGVWAVEASAKNGWTLGNIAYNVVVGVVVLCCFLIFLTSDTIVDNNAFGGYCIEFHQRIAFWGGKKIEYGSFTLVMCAIYTVLATTEIVMALMAKSETITEPETIESKVLKG